MSGHDPVGPLSAPLLSGAIAGRDIVQVGWVAGDLIQHIERAAYRLDPWQERTPEGKWRQPSRLLAAHNAVVPFDEVRRAPAINRVTAWRDEPDQPLSVLLVHGPGGQGKTRLADHVARRAGAEGWRVVTAHQAGPSARPRAPAQAADESALGVLVLVDYAERWPADDLLALVDDLSAIPLPVRLLLLARPSGLWWTAFAHDLHEREIGTGTLALPPLAVDPQDRQAMFAQARDAFARALDVPDAQAITAPASLAGDRFQSVLTVHMAALVAVYHGAGDPVRDDPVALAAYLLEREQAHWRRMYRSHAIGTRPDTIGAATYLATLTGGLPHGEAVTVLRDTAVVSTVEAAREVLADHGLCYPPAESGRVLSPLYPDRLGEDFLALQTPLTEPAPYLGVDPWEAHGYQPDPWADTVLTPLLTPKPDTDLAGYVRPAITTLIETAQRWPHIARQRLYPLLLAHPQLAVAAGTAALVALAGLADDPAHAQVLDAVADALPDDRDLALDVGAAAITERVLAHRLDTAADVEDRIGLLMQMAMRYYYAGLPDRGAATLAQAIEPARELARDQDPEHEESLAIVLYVCGMLRSEVGGNDGALELVEEGMTILARLVEGGRAESRLGLAESLTNLSKIQAELGNPEEGLAAAQRAVGLHRELVAENPGVDQRTGLAILLVNLGLLRFRLGHWTEAVDAAGEAVELLLPLVETNPELTPMLSRAAGNLSEFQIKVNQRSDAADLIGSTIDRLRGLMDINPNVFRPDLARSLLTRSRQLTAAGRDAEAGQAIEEAVACYRELAAANPALYRHNLSVALANEAVVLDKCGESRAALDRVTEAIDHCEELMATSRWTIQPDLARAHRTMAVIHARLADNLAAATAEERSIRYFRELADRQPAVYQRELAESLRTLALRQRNLNNYEDALATIEEAIALEPTGRGIAVRGGIHRAAGRLDAARLDLDQGMALDPQDWWALAERGELHRQAGDFDRALADLDRVIAASPEDIWARARRGVTYRQLARPADALADLDPVLNRNPEDASFRSEHGEALRLAGRAAEAIADFDLALRALPDNAWLLGRRGSAHRILGDLDQSLADLDAAVRLEPDDPWLAAERGETHRFAGDLEAAVADFDAALRLQPADGWTLARRGVALRELRRFAESMSDLDEAVRLNPEDRFAICERAESHRFAGDFAVAVEGFDAALRSGPDDAWSLSRRGAALRGLDRLAESVSDLDEAARLNPEDHWTMCERAESHRFAGDFAVAVEGFDAALRIEPDDAWCLSRRGATYTAMGRPGPAIADFDAALRLIPDDPWILAERGGAHRQQGDLDVAIADFDAALAIDPTDRWALATRGQTHRWRGNLDAALADLDRAIELGMVEGWVLAERGEVHRLRGNFDRATADLGHAIDLVPTAWSYARRGEAHRQAGRVVEAIADFNASLQLDSGDAWTIAGRGQCHQQLGRYREALADLDRAVELDPASGWISAVRNEVRALMGN